MKDDKSMRGINGKEANEKKKRFAKLLFWHLSHFSISKIYTEKKKLGHCTQNYTKNIVLLIDFVNYTNFNSSLEYIKISFFFILCSPPP